MFKIIVFLLLRKTIFLGYKNHASHDTFIDCYNVQNLNWKISVNISFLIFK